MSITIAEEAQNRAQARWIREHKPNGCHRVAEYTNRGWPIACGDWRNGRVLCEQHEKAAAKRYPQGWRYYPSDVCPHGVYTGGSGVDWMCGACEMGE